MTKPTGNPVGRPKTKEYSTLLARVPQDLVDRVKRYASIHRSTVAELIRDGLEWRITEGDPRNAFMYDTNHGEYSGNTEKQTYLPETDLTPDILDAEDLEEMPLAPVDTHQQPTQPALDYDATKYTLGKLCPRGHEWGTTGQSLLQQSNHKCLICHREQGRTRRETKRQAGQLDAPAMATPAPAVSPRGSVVWDKASVLAQLDAWKAAGVSLQTMADRLNTSEVPTFSGKGTWNKGTISKLLAEKHQAMLV